MTYAMSLNNVGFAELSNDEKMCVDGGGWIENLARTVTTTIAQAIITHPVEAIAIAAVAYIASEYKSSYDKGYKEGYNAGMSEPVVKK